MKNMYSVFSKFTNGTEHYLVVGNSQDVISHHQTVKEAEKALSAINVSDSKWSVIKVLCPGESHEGTYQNFIHEDTDNDFSLGE
jgi:hypothetical protein